MITVQYITYNIKVMSLQKSWKTYYSLEESSQQLDKSIEKSADLLVAELKTRKKSREIEYKKVAHV